MHQMRMSITYISSMMLRAKNLEIRNSMTVKTQNKTKQTAVKWSQIRRAMHEDRAMHEEDDPSF
jgi:hypothetical protein